jgi:hypothetical protein
MNRSSFMYQYIHPYGCPMNSNRGTNSNNYKNNCVHGNSHNNNANKMQYSRRSPRPPLPLQTLQPSLHSLLPVPSKQPLHSIYPGLPPSSASQHKPPQSPARLLPRLPAPFLNHPIIFSNEDHLKEDNNNNKA